MKKLYASLLFLGFYTGVVAQCTLVPNATAGLTLTQQGTNHNNNSGVAYNPGMGLYYGVRAGNSGFPLDTWNSVGTQLYQTTAGFDWRGMWWNPNTNQLEGNGYSTFGMWRANLNGSGYALNTGANLFTGQNQPDAQSCGDLDWQANEVLYYFNGNIYRYSRATNAFLGSYPITGTPVAIGNLNWTTLCFTGCSGMEIALLDYVNKRVYLYNKANGAYAGMSQLPLSAVTSNGFRTSWANNLIWLWNLSNYTWYSYNIFSAVLSANILELNAEPTDPFSIDVNWVAEGEPSMLIYQVERSTDGVSFSSVGEPIPAREISHNTYRVTDQNFPAAKILYYRLRMILQDGSESYSRVATVLLNASPEDFVTAFPNPSEGIFNVCVKSSIGSEIFIQMTDMSGKIIFSESHEALQSLDCSKIDLSEFSSGTYLLLVNAGGRLFHEKLMIDK